MGTVFPLTSFYEVLFLSLQNHVSESNRVHLGYLKQDYLHLLPKLLTYMYQLLQEA